MSEDRRDDTGRLSGKKWMQFVFALVLMTVIVISAAVNSIDDTVVAGFVGIFGMAAKALFDKEE